MVIQQPHDGADDNLEANQNRPKACFKPSTY